MGDVCSITIPHNMIVYSHTAKMIANDIYTKCRLLRLKELLLGVILP